MSSPDQPVPSKSTSVVRVLGTSVGLTVAGFVIGIVCTLVVAIGLVAVGVPILERPLLEVVLSVLMLQGVGFGSAALGYLYLRDGGFGMLMLRTPTLRDGLWTVAGLIGLFAALIALNLVLLTLGIEGAEHQFVGLGQENPEVLLVLIPLSIVLVGPAEELLFRGVIQRLLVDRFGLTVGIGVASVIFAVAHVGALISVDLVQLASTLGIYIVLSVILGVVYEYSGNLVVPAMIHGLFNAIQFGLLYWLISRGIEPMAVLLVL